MDLEVDSSSKELERSSTPESIIPIIASGSVSPVDDGTELRVSSCRKETIPVTAGSLDTNNSGNLVSTSEATREDPDDLVMRQAQPSSSNRKDQFLCNGESHNASSSEDTVMVDSETLVPISKEALPGDNNLFVESDSADTVNKSADMNQNSYSFLTKGKEKVCNGYHPSETSPSGSRNWKNEPPFNSLEADDRNGATRAGIPG